MNVGIHNFIADVYLFCTSVKPFLKNCVKLLDPNVLLSAEQEHLLQSCSRKRRHNSDDIPVETSSLLSTSLDNGGDVSRYYLKQIYTNKYKK